MTKIFSKISILTAICLYSSLYIYAQELSLSARLSQPDGSPLEGVVDLRFELSYSGSPETIICTKDLTGTNLTNGLFQLGLTFSTAECGGSSLSAVLEGVPASESMLFRVVDVTDSANPRTYPFQSLKAVPLSVRSEVAQTLARNSAVEGQVLRFVGGEWVASNETAEVGTVSEINTGAGLVGGPITSSGTIAIASSGVTSAMVADGTLVDADISAGASLARTKLASGSANYVLVNNGSGVMSEVAQLPLSQGGTGAANASDARFNLGLGNAALRDVGLLAGELLDAGEIPSCALDEKIRKVVMPVAGFVCESGADATKLALAGGTMSGNIDMNANAITNLLDPSLAQDAATKAYVDGQIGGGAANQWSESGGNVYRTSGNVGIGTSNPTDKLTVTGDVRLTGRLYKSDGSLPMVIYVNGTGGSDTNDGLTPSTSLLTLDRAFAIISTLPDQYFRISLTGGSVNFNSNKRLVNKSIVVNNSNFDALTINWNASLFLNNSTLNFSYTNNSSQGFLGDINVNTVNGAFISSSGFNIIVTGGFYRMNWIAGVEGATIVVRNEAGNGQPMGGVFHFISGWRSAFTNPNSVTNYYFDRSIGANFTNNSEAVLHGNPGALSVSEWVDRVDASGRRIFGNRLASQSEGSANLPAIALGATNGVGFFTDSTNILGLSTAGAERVRITNNGNVGIGVLTPEAKLDINGQIKISGGAPGSGKVLTSDASGLASWVAPSTTATPTGAAGGDLAGNYPNPVVASGAIIDAKVAAGANIAQSKIANLATDLAGKQAIDDDLTGISGITTTGIVVRTGSGTYQTRALQGVADRTIVSNGDGIAANPNIDVSTALLPSPLAGDTGKFLRATGANNSSWLTLTESDITTALGFSPLNKAGDSAGSGVFDFNSSSIVRVNDPIGTRDVANKSYVDTQVSSAANQWTATGGNIYRSSGNVGIGTSSPTAKLDVAGNLLSTNNRSYLITRTTPSLVGDYVELGRFSYGNRGYNIKIDLIYDRASVAVAKTYLVPVRYYPSDNWFKLLPISQSIWGTDDFAIDIRPGTFSSSHLVLRLRRTSGSLNGSLQVRIEQIGYVATSFEELTGVGSATEPASFFDSTAMTQIDGKIGVGTEKPTKQIHMHSTGTDNYLHITSSLTGDTLLDGFLIGTGAVGDAAIYNRENTNMLFFTNNTERLRISNTGSVGIGTQNPDAPLVIQAPGASGSGQLILRDPASPNGSSNRGPHMFFDNADGEKGWVGFFDNSVHGGGTQLNLRSFSGPVNITAASSGSHLLVTQAGNVGIGTTNPAAKLDINGEMRATNSLTAKGFISNASLDNDRNPGIYGVNYTGHSRAIVDFYTGGGSTPRFQIMAHYDDQIYFRAARDSTTNWDSRGFRRLVIEDEAGNVGLGTSTPSQKLDVVGNVRATSFISTSDRRLKKEIRSTAGLEKVRMLDGVKYRWRDNDEKEFGVIAQDLEKVFPDLVVTDEKSGYKSVKYQGLIAPLIESIKDLYRDLTTVKNSSRESAKLMKRYEQELRAQKREISSLREKNKQLESKQSEILKRLERLEK